MYYSLCYSNNFMNSSEKNIFYKTHFEIDSRYFLPHYYLSIQLQFLGWKKKRKLKKKSFNSLTVFQI